MLCFLGGKGGVASWKKSTACSGTFIAEHHRL